MKKIKKNDVAELKQGGVEKIVLKTGVTLVEIVIRIGTRESPLQRFTKEKTESSHFKFEDKSRTTHT